MRSKEEASGRRREGVDFGDVAQGLALAPNVVTQVRANGDVTLNVEVSPPERASAEGTRQEAFDVALAQKTACCIAAELVRRHALRARDFDDTVQDLLLHALQRWHKFDPARGSAATFLDRVMRTGWASWARKQHARKRGLGREHSWTDLGLTPHRDRLEALGGTYTQRDAVQWEIGCGVRDVVARMPPELQVLCGLIANGGISAAARALGVPRQRLRLPIREVRRRFRKAGLEELL